MAVDVELRDVMREDLPVFFEDQLDPEAIAMAAFTPRKRAAFMTHWETKILGDDSVVKRTILADGQVAGNIVCFESDGEHLVGYWIGRSFWGRGVATRALAQFVELVPARPLYAYVAKRNPGSIRVLEKCGFAICGEARKPGDVEELVMRLG